MPKELILTGKVQGVFCRQFCTQNAKKLGLTGSASNLSDGSVRVILNTEDEEKISRFIHALKTNPYNFTFFGSISNITIKDYSGPVRGDYHF